MPVESYLRAPSQPSVYEGLPEAWFDSTANIGEPRQFRPPYAFNETWQEIVADFNQSEDPTPGQSLESKWRAEVTCWPRCHDDATYLGATFISNKQGQRLYAYWNNAYYHDVIDTLDEVPGTAILKAIVNAQAYRVYRQELTAMSIMELYVQTRPVLSSNKPLEQHISRYKKRENVPAHRLTLPIRSPDYLWVPQRDAFLADYRNHPNAPGDPAEVSTDEFFAIARAIVALARLEKGDDSHQPTHLLCSCILCNVF